MKKIFNLILLSFVMIVAFTSCQDDKDIPAPTPKNTDGQLHVYKIVVETFDLDTSCTSLKTYDFGQSMNEGIEYQVNDYVLVPDMEYKYNPDDPKPTITIEGSVGKKAVAVNGNTITFDLNKGESYFLTIKASRSTWFRVYTYVNGKKVKWSAGSCPGLSYITFDTRR